MIMLSAANMGVSDDAERAADVRDEGVRRMVVLYCRHVLRQQGWIL